MGCLTHAKGFGRNGEDGNTLSQASGNQSRVYIELRARLREQKRNIAIVDGEIRSAKGEILAECSCTYFTFDAAHAPEQVPYNPTETIGEELTREEVLTSLGVEGLMLKV